MVTPMAFGSSLYLEADTEGDRPNREGQGSPVLISTLFCYSFTNDTPLFCRAGMIGLFKGYQVLSDRQVWHLLPVDLQ